MADDAPDEGGSSDVYISQYLTFEALEDRTFSFSKIDNPEGSVSYSIDNGTSWTAFKCW